MLFNSNGNINMINTATTTKATTNSKGDNTNNKNNKNDINDSSFDKNGDRHKRSSNPTNSRHSKTRAFFHLSNTYDRVESIGEEKDDDDAEFCYEPQDFVRINVSGMLYETLQTTLGRFPDTLLGDVLRRNTYYVQSKNAFFFDRHRTCFEAILYYYQSNGILAKPNNIPMFLFKQETHFFGLRDDILDGGDVRRRSDVVLPENVWQRRLWQFLEYPESSIGAKVLTCWSIFVVIISIVAYCMETIPYPHSSSNTRNTSTNTTGHHNRTTTTKPAQSHIHHSHTSEVWSSIELCCVVWFTFEYTIRLFSSPEKKTFLRSFLNFIDVLAILPYFLSILIHSHNVTGLTAVRTVRLIRVVRVLRILKLSRHSDSLQILGETLRASVSELLMLLFFILLAMILFSSGIYYAEQGSNPMFTSIPDTFWYSLTTMKTLGYGDKIPKTNIGKIIGSFCAVSGVLTIALPVPIIVANFKYFCRKFRHNLRSSEHDLIQ